MLIIFYNLFPLFLIIINDSLFLGVVVPLYSYFLNNNLLQRVHCVGPWNQPYPFKF